MTEFCFLSYNIRGMTRRSEFLQDLVSPSVIGNKVPIVAIQEHFMLLRNSYKVEQAFPGFRVFIKGAVKEILDSGRPKGGLCIAVPEELAESVLEVSPENWRASASA